MMTEVRRKWVSARLVTLRMEGMPNEVLVAPSTSIWQPDAFHVGSQFTLNNLTTVLGH